MSRQARDPISGSWCTVAGAGGSDTNFEGSLAQWEALSPAEKAKYKTVDINNDFNGMPIDDELSETSVYPVQNKVIAKEVPGVKGLHKYNFVSMGAGWNGYCYGFVPLANANKHTLTLISVSYFNGSTLTDVTTSFSINDNSRSKDGFAIQCVSTRDYIGKAMMIEVEVT